MKKLVKIYEDINQAAIANANSIILMRKLQDDAKFMSMLQQIQSPTDKYTAIMLFGDLLGIPKERFVDFVNNMETQTNK
jgi:hypothetical protein